MAQQETSNFSLTRLTCSAFIIMPFSLTGETDPGYGQAGIIASPRKSLFYTWSITGINFSM